MPVVPMIPLNAGASPTYLAGGVVPRGPVESTQMEALGEATARSGAAIGTLATGLQDQLNESRTKEGYTSLAKQTTTLLEDPKTGYFNKRGKEAVGQSREQALQSIDDARRQIEKGLDNDTQRGMFREAADRFMIGVTGRVYGHEAEQFRSYSARESDKMSDQAIDDAANAKAMEPPPGQEQSAAELAAAAQVRANAERMQNGENPSNSPSLLVQGPGPRATVNIGGVDVDVGTWQDQPGVRQPGPLQSEAAPQEPATPQPSKPRTSDYELHKNTAISQANTFADLQGWPTDSAQRKQYVLSKTTALHEAVIDRLIGDDRSKDAATYLDSVPKVEMTPEAYAKAHREVEHAKNLSKQEKVDKEAWDLSTKLSNSEMTEMEQKAAIESAVRQGASAEVGLKAWDLVRNFAEQKWQDKQRERASVKEWLEQTFNKALADGQDVTVDNLTPKEKDRIDKAGMRGEAYKIHRDARTRMLADAYASGELDSMTLGRDLTSAEHMAKMADELEKRLPAGDAAKTPQGITQLVRMQKQIESLREQSKAIMMRPRTFTLEWDLPAGVRSGTKKQPFDIDMALRKLGDSVPDMLWPGAGK